MQTYEVVAKPDALDDLAAIRDHIAHRFGFPSSARSTLRSIKKGLETLGIMRDGCGWSTGSPGTRAGSVNAYRRLFWSSCSRAISFSSKRDFLAIATSYLAPIGSGVAELAVNRKRWEARRYGVSRPPPAELKHHAMGHKSIQLER